MRIKRIREGSSIDNAPTKKPSPSPSSNRSLVITEIAKTSLNQVVNILKDWEEIADQKSSQTPLEQEQNIFDDLSFASFATTLAPLSTEKEYTYLVCKSNNFPETVQALAIIKERPNHLLLDTLLTHPHNVRSSANDSEPEKVSGAGTALIQHIFNRCVKNEINEISLTHLDSSLPFYQKHGFSSLTASHLSITQEQIQEQLKKVS